MRDEAHKQLLGEMERSAQLSEQYDDVLGQIQGAPNPSTQRSALKKRKQHLRRERAVTEANMAALENTIESAINADLLSEKYEEMSDELLVALVYQPYRSTQPNVSGAANAELDRRHSAMMKKSSTMTTILSVIAILIAVLALLIAVLALLITAFS
jgi:cell division protein FtsB